MKKSVFGLKRMKFQIRNWDNNNLLGETDCRETAVAMATAAGFIPEPNCKFRYFMAVARVDEWIGGKWIISFSPLFPNPRGIWTGTGVTK